MTKQQQLSFYKELLKVVCEDSDTNLGFCYYITCDSDIRNWYLQNQVKRIDAYNGSSFKRRLPELYAHRPQRCGDYWFSCNKQGWETRISILEKVIKDLKKEIAATRRKKTH